MDELLVHAHLLGAVESPDGGLREGAHEGLDGDVGESRGLARRVGRLACRVGEHLDGAEREHALEGLAHRLGVRAVDADGEHLGLGFPGDLVGQPR